MARKQFGGVMAAWIVEKVDLPNAEIGTGTEGVTTVVTFPTTDVAITVYDAPDGTVVTDLLDSDGVTPITEISVPAGDPYIPLVYGPDGMDNLWVQSDNGHWLPIPAYAVESAEDDPLTDVVKLSGSNTYLYPDSQTTDPWLRVQVPNDGSDSGTWKNRMEWQYWDDNTSKYQTGFYLNEKCLLRVRGVTPNDVAVRFMAHQNLSQSLPIMETAGNDNTVKYFQSFEHKTVSVVPMQVPYLTTLDGTRLYFSAVDPTIDDRFADFRPDIGSIWIDPNNA